MIRFRFINPENDDMDKLIARMRETANIMLDQIGFEFHSPESGIDCECHLNYRRNLYLVYKEALQNIVWHSKATHVRIEISRKDQFITLRVADDGVGFDVATGDLELRGGGSDAVEDEAPLLRRQRRHRTAIGVDVGGIEEVHALVQSQGNRLVCLFLVRAKAECHCPKAYLRNLEPALSQSAIVQNAPPQCSSVIRLVG